MTRAIGWRSRKAWCRCPTHVIHAKGSDGLPIEAYLTLPKGDRPRPLVVLAHGGPIGVRDTLRFDPEVQFIASLGYAVLQVNFRGSEGFGKSFLEAVPEHARTMELYVWQNTAGDSGGMSGNFP